MAEDPIIVTGGSVEINFNENTFTGGDGRYGNAERRIVSIEVVDDNTGLALTVPIPTNGKCTVRVITQ